MRSAPRAVHRVETPGARREPGPDSVTKVCAQCGRIGTRGFTSIPDGDVMAIRLEHIVIAAHSMTVCASKSACMKRWPKRTEWDE
jgi:hypothetical protein